MRIGIDARLWNETGVGRYIRNLVNELGKIDTINHYTLFLRKSEFDLIELPGKNFEKKLADVRWHSFSEQVSFAKILNKEKLDIVHFPYFSVPLMYRKPYIITIHDLILNHYPSGKASTLFGPLYWMKHIGYRYILAQAAEYAKKIISVSTATKSEVIDHLTISPNKISVIYEGVDSNILQIKDSTTQLDIKGEYFLYVGNAYPHKNLEFLVTAFKNVVQKNPKISLVLVGKEDYFYIRLKEFIYKNNLDRSVLIYGEVSDSDLSALYSNALALVYPSLMEGFGLPLLEAMAHKCLILASDIPVFKEIAGDNIVYFNNTSISSLVNRMDEVLFNGKKEYKSLIAMGYKRSHDFSWEKMAKQTLEVYNSSV